MLSYNLSGKNLTVVLDGNVYTIHTDRPEAAEIQDIINQKDPDNIDEFRLKTLLDRATAVRDYYHNEIEIKGEGIYYRGNEIKGELVDDILRYMEEGAPYRPLIRYLENLMNNLSYKSIEQLYTFHKHNNLQITEDGYLIAYKGVKDDYYDRHSGTVWNGPGGGPLEPMARNRVDDNPDVACAPGYHVGSLEYARDWGDRVMRVKVNPADVVSVPKDHDCAKVRVTFYKVMDEVDPHNIKKLSMYNNEY